MAVSVSLGSLLGIQDLLWCASRLESRDSVWIPETWGMECFGVMSAVAKDSRCRTIGSSIINVYSRSPAAIAMGAATIDTISGGRFILGLGASSPAIVGNLHGLAYDKPIKRISECIDIVRLALGGNTIQYDGEIFQLRGFSLLVEPPRDIIPIFIAAVNPAMVRLAWRKADGVIFYLRPASEIASTLPAMQQKRRIRTACQIITVVSEDVEAAKERGRRTLAFYVSVGDIYARFLAGHGYPQEVSAIREGYRTGGLDAAVSSIPDIMLSEMTACGTPKECRRTLARYTHAGITDVIAQFNPVGDVHESFELFCEVLH